MVAKKPDANTISVLNPLDSPGEAFLQALYDGISEAVLAVGLPTWQIVYWNKGAEVHFGRNVEEVKDQSLACIYPDESAFARMQVLCKPVLEERGSWYGEWQLRRRDESIFPAEVTFKTFLTGNDGNSGNSAYVVMVVRDVTGRKEAEAEIERRNTFLLLHDRVATATSEARGWKDALGATLQHLCVYTDWLVGHVWLYDQRSHSLECTHIWHFVDEPARYEQFRTRSEELSLVPETGLVGRALSERKPQWIEDISQSTSNLRRQAAARASGLRSAFAFPVLLHDEVVAVLEFFGSAASHRDDALIEVAETLGVHLGRIFERQDAAEKLQEKDRLAAMGITAAKIAHEIGNPLNGMFTTAQLLERHFVQHRDRAMDDAAVDTIRALVSETDRLRSLLEKLGDLSFLGPLDLVDCNLAELIAGLLKTQSNVFREAKIRVKREFSRNLPKVPLDRARFRQALLNLLNNAIDAMPDGGILTMRGYTDKGRLFLEVEDTGSGIPEDLPVFDLFTTSKSSGSGLGLPVVRQIVAAHGGSIHFWTRPGQGTTFQLTLPLSR